MELDAIVSAVVSSPSPRRPDAGDAPCRLRRCWTKRDGEPVNIHNRWFQLVASVIAVIMIANRGTVALRQADATGDRLEALGYQWAFTLFILFRRQIRQRRDS
jgi:hypothetical protein